MINEYVHAVRRAGNYHYCSPRFPRGYGARVSFARNWYRAFSPGATDAKEPDRSHRRRQSAVQGRESE